MSSSKSLGVFDFSSVGQGLHCVQGAFLEGFRVIEVVPRGPGLTLLIEAPGEGLRKLIEDMTDDEQETVVIIEDSSERSLKALYSLDQSPLLGHILIVESDRAGVLLHLANQALSRGLFVSELKIPRGSNARGGLYITSDREDQLASFRSQIGDGVQRVTLIPNLHPEFKRYFDYTPAQSKQPNQSTDKVT